MTPRELAEKICNRLADLNGIPGMGRGDHIQVIESLLAEALGEAKRDRCCHCDCHELAAVGDGCFTCIDQRTAAKAAAYEECAKIAEAENRNAKEMGDEECDCAEKIRLRAKELGK